MASAKEVPSYLPSCFKGARLLYEATFALPFLCQEVHDFPCEATFTPSASLPRGA